MAKKWLILGLISLMLFLIYSAIYATGVLNISTLQVELWLMHRPLTRIDCIFYEWRNLGEVPSTLGFLALLSLICLRLGYRWRVVPLLFLLLAVGLEAEL